MRSFFSATWRTFKGLSLTLLVCALLVATGYAFVVEGEQRQISSMAERLDRLQRDVERAKQKNRRLKALIGRMQTSDELAEKIAREDSGLIKEGEILYIFPH
jgi:cell division protein FtsB